MKRSKTMMVVFTAPAIFFFLLIFIYPSLRTLLMSFYKVKNINDSMDTWTFVGFNNYLNLAVSDMFRQSMFNIFRIWLYGGIFVFFFALLFAVILTSGVKGKSFFRAVLYLPNVVCAVAMATMWLHYVYQPTYGLMTSIFKFLGLTGLAAIQWTSVDYIFIGMTFAYSFGMVGYFVLIFIAAIDRIPIDFFEAATIEGANKITKFFKIILPLMRDVLRTSVVLWSICAIGFFVWTQIFSLFTVAPGTVTPMAYMYQMIFGRDLVVTNPDLINVGSGAGVGVIMTILVIAVFSLFNLLMRSDKNLEY